MTYSPDIPEVSQWSHYDLMDFNDLRLTSAGELELSAYQPVDAVLKLGHNVLSLTSIESGEANPQTGRPGQLYIVRNLTAQSAEAFTTLDNTPRPDGDHLVGDSPMTIYRSPSLVIGRGKDATPELELDSTASRHHTLLRVGALASNLHIADLYSTNGTHVYLNPAVNHGRTSPSRRFSYDPATGLTTSYEAARGRWTRHDDL